MSARPTLYHLPASGALPTLCPFCLKAETWFRFAGVAHDTRPAMFADSPTGKLPYLEHGGDVVADSDRMIEWASRRWGVDLDAWLSPADRARAVALQAMFEHGYYFAITWVKFRVPENLHGVRAWLAANVDPARLDAAVRGYQQYAIRKTDHQGIGDLRPDEVDALAHAWIDAAAAALGDRPFLFGDRPTTADATMYAFLVKTLRDFTVGPFKGRIAAHPNLLGFIERVDAAYWT